MRSARTAPRRFSTGSSARRLVGEAASVPFDLALLTNDANDALGLRSRATLTRDVRAIVLTLRAALTCDGAPHWRSCHANPHAEITPSSE